MTSFVTNTCAVKYKAQPYDDDVMTVIENISNLWLRYFQTEGFPEVDKERNWDLYLLSKKQTSLGGLQLPVPNVPFLNHYSLLFVDQANHQCCFFIDLVKTPIDVNNPAGLGMKVKLRVSKPNQFSLEKKLSQLCLGTLSSTSAQTISIRAHECLKNMGGYQACLNNCQNYCKALAKDFDCNDHGVFTVLDGIKLSAIITVIASVLLVVVVVVAKRC